MPGPEFYRGMAVAEALRALAEHHIHQETRHISGFEYELIFRAATKLAEVESRSDGPTDDTERAT